MCCDTGTVEFLDDCVSLPCVLSECVLWMEWGADVDAVCAIVAA